MQTKNVTKLDFYSEALGLITNARKSIFFYTVSCCFGFYSLGLKTFEQMLSALNDKISLKVKGKVLDVRILLKIDRDCVMDTYAVERMNDLERRMRRFRGSGSDSIIFKEMTTSGEHLQFLIIDDDYVLVTGHQEEKYSELLDMVLNRIEYATRFRKDEDRNEYRRLSELFNSSWQEGYILNLAAPEVSIRKLKFCLKNYQWAGEIRLNSEREFQIHLAGYVKGNFPGALISTENPAGKTRIDIAIGREPQSKRIGIETKYKVTTRNVDEIIGQIAKYSREYERVILAVLDPRYSRQDQHRLNEELRRRNCEFYSYHNL